MYPMLRQVLVGSSICVLNIVIHALLTVTTIHVARVFSKKNASYPWLHLVTVMIATVFVLMGAHMLEVFVWSIAYAAVDAVPEGGDIVYFAFVNYSTLGYGDIVPVARWHLLGPMAAMNGILLFGWSTAVIFEVLRRTISEQASVAHSSRN
jgi:hypothetical protein